MMWVYPRLRGGSRGVGWAASRLLGLSPPTRGIRAGAVVGLRGLRSIPAYAGDPPMNGLRRYLGRVYPRLRGGSGNRGFGALTA